MTLQDQLSSTVAFFRISIVILAIVAAAGALAGTQYFGNAYAFQQAQNALAMMDYLALFLTVGFFAVSVGLASLSRNNRIFLPVSIVFLVLTVLLSAIFSDVYFALVETQFFGNAASTLPILNLIASNMPLVYGVMGLVIIIASYTNLTGGGRRAPR